MTTRTWVGSSSDILASTSSNWNPAGNVGSSDICIFDHTSSYNCTWDVASVGQIKCSMPPAKGQDDELGVSYGFFDETTGTSRIITFTSNVTCNGIYFNCMFKATSAIEITISGTYTIGAPNLRPVTFGELAAFTNRDNFTFKVVTPSNTSICLEDGIYPNLHVSGHNLGLGYNAETNNRVSGFKTVDIKNLTLALPTTKISSSTVLNDRNKKYVVNGSISITDDSFDAGYTTWVLTPTSSGLRIPVTGDISNFGGGTAFTAKYHNLEIQRGSSDGHYAFIEDGLTLICDSLKVEAGALLKPESNTKGNVIKTNSKPNILGSWDFFDVGAGMYHSDPTNAAFISPKAGSSGQVLTVVNGVPDWSTITSDVSSQSTLDVGTLISSNNQSTVVFGTLTL